MQAPPEALQAARCADSSTTTLRDLEKDHKGHRARCRSIGPSRYMQSQCYIHQRIVTAAGSGWGGVRQRCWVASVRQLPEHEARMRLPASSRAKSMRIRRPGPQRAGTGSGLRTAWAYRRRRSRCHAPRSRRSCRRAPRRRRARPRRPCRQAQAERARWAAAPRRWPRLRSGACAPPGSPCGQLALNASCPPFRACFVEHQKRYAGPR